MKYLMCSTNFIVNVNNRDYLILKEGKKYEILANHNVINLTMENFFDIKTEIGAVIRIYSNQIFQGRNKYLYNPSRNIITENTKSYSYTFFSGLSRNVNIANILDFIAARCGDCSISLWENKLLAFNDKQFEMII